MVRNRSFLLVTILSVLWILSLHGLSVAAEQTAPQPKNRASEKVQPQYQEKFKVDRPDLVVDKFEVATILPGEPNVDGVTYTTKHLYFVWYVRNRGNAVSNPTTLKVSCTNEQPRPSVQCPPGLSKDYDIVTLWPRPDEISGAQVVWNSPAVPAPDKGVTYRFSAQVNPKRDIKEITYSNNVLNTHYTEGELLHLLPAGQFHSIVEKEKNANRAAITDIATLEKPKPGIQPGSVTPISPIITIQNILIQPAAVKATSSFDLTIQFLNTGNLAVNPGKQYSLSCKVLSGGPGCQLPSGTYTINQSMEPNAIFPAKFAGNTGPAGTYELTVKLLPEKPGDTPRTVQVTIEPGPTVPKIPVKTNPTTKESTKTNPLTNRGSGPALK